MRRAAKVDNNHSEVMLALRQAGMTAKSVAIMKGFCDIVIGYRNLNLLVEVKDGSLPPSARKLTADEQAFHDSWGGRVVVVDSPIAAVEAMVNYAKEMGRL